MTDRIPLWLRKAASAAVRLPALLKPSAGQHRAYRAGDAPWEPPTPLPELPPLPPFRPRYVPDVRATGQLVREMYAVIESRLASQLYSVAPWDVFANV